MRLKVYIFTPKALENTLQEIEYVDWKTVIFARSLKDAKNIFAEMVLGHQASRLKPIKDELLEDFNIEERKAQRGIIWNNSTLRRGKVLPDRLKIV